VLVVEHEEEIIRAADEIIDVGPFAGRLGERSSFTAPVRSLLNKYGSYGKIPARDMKIDVPPVRRKWNNYIEISEPGE